MAFTPALAPPPGHVYGPGNVGVPHEHPAAAGRGAGAPAPARPAAPPDSDALRALVVGMTSGDAQVAAEQGAA